MAQCTKLWLAEWREHEEDGEDIADKVSLTLIEIPTTREALASWLFAFEVRAC